MPWSSPTCPVLFINVEGSEQRSSGGGGSRQAGSRGDDEGGCGGGGSYSNPAEAEVAMKVLLRVLQQDEGITSIALLSPYRCAACMCWAKWGRPASCGARSAQCPDLLYPGCRTTTTTPAACHERSGQVRLLNSLLSRAQLPEGAAQRCTLAVSTVDGYQGREADCVVFSSVRWSVVVICLTACTQGPIAVWMCCLASQMHTDIRQLPPRGPCLPAACCAAMPRGGWASSLMSAA